MNSLLRDLEIERATALIRMRLTHLRAHLASTTQTEDIRTARQHVEWISEALAELELAQ